MDRRQNRRLHPSAESASLSLLCLSLFASTTNRHQETRIARIFTDEFLAAQSPAAGGMSRTDAIQWNQLLALTPSLSPWIHRYIQHRISNAKHLMSSGIIIHIDFSCS